jgi:anti-sigma-K factor RsiG
MTSAQETLAPLLVDGYLDDLGAKELDQIRAMRTDCQHAEVALSYVRRLIQGRLDIVNTFLEYPPVGASPDLGALVRDLPGILSSGPGRGPGFGHLPMLIGPDTESELTDELMAELDSVLGAEEIGRLSDLRREDLEDLSARLTDIERRVSRVRRALHERIDALQAEVVRRHKTGRASVDELLG